MRARKLGFGLILIAVACGAWFAGRGYSADTPNAAKPGDDELAKVDLSYAEASAKLAEVELTILKQANEKLANAFPKTAIQKLTMSVDIANWRLDHVKKKTKVSEYDNYLIVAEADMKTAELEYQTALAADKQVKNAVSPLTLQQLKLLAEIAKLRFERVRAAKGQPELVFVRWQLQDQREQIRRLSQMIELYRGNE